MRRCPTEYYTNCANASIKCAVCKAGTMSRGKLHYSPIDSSPELADHPAEPKNRVNSEASKRGRQNERVIKRSILRHSNRVSIRHNAGSGALNGDGDLTISTEHQELRVEAKHRGALRRWYLTDKEYSKGCIQGIELYAITRTNPDTNLDETLYMMSEETLINLLEGNING